MRTSRRLILVIAVIFVAFSPAFALAQQSPGFDIFPIVTCGTQETPPCTPCGLLDLTENVVKFVTIGVTGPVAALMFIYSGFLFLFYAANPSMVSRAKTVMTNTVYGVAIILMAWIIVVQLIKTVAPSSAADRWFEFNCPAFLGGVGIPVDIGRPEPGLRDVFTDLRENTACTEGNFQFFADTFNTNVNPEAIAPELVTLRDCLLADPIINAAHDPDRLFTFERNRPICNLLRGYANCGACQHSLFSCHYGGGNGSTGAQAIDFNFIGARTGKVVQVVNPTTGKLVQVSSERDLADQLVRAAREAIPACNYKLLSFEGDHTHISTLACDSDGQTTRIQGLP